MKVVTTALLLELSLPRRETAPKHEACQQQKVSSFWKVPEIKQSVPEPVLWHQTSPSTASVRIGQRVGQGLVDSPDP